ncbi:MAG: hypothetical protein E4H40_05845 [Candidatus Brocadiia bacterium]|nr:MAG: hypothetical protein E4H40_05845 [Candidatus Brocadiia bacterium]
MVLKRYLILAVISVGMSAFILTASSTEQLTDKQQSLSEIKALYVFVQGLNAETAKAGLTREKIETKVSNKLKQLNVKVVSEEEGLTLAGSPVLYVKVTARKRERLSAFIFHVEVGLLQKVSLVREPRVQAMSITWNKGSLGYCSGDAFAETIEGVVADLMEKFGSDYSSANP